MDPTFSSGTGAGAAAGNDPEVNTIVRLPNGQFLIGGYFTTYNGFPCNGLARLNADGSFDATFSTNLGADSYIVNVVAQPDGKILLTGSVYVGSATSGQSLVRLLAAGMPDPAFAPPAFPDFAIFSYSGPAIQVQADGKILVASRVGVPSAGVPRLVRLNPNGSVDPSYQVGDGPNSLLISIRLLANGRLLVAGSFTNFNGTLDRSLVQITSTGAVDASFQPVIQTAGSIRDVVQQPDGKLLVGGSFSEINGQAVRRVARFNPNGSLDATFAANTDIDGAVVSLALQPDGRLLAANPQTVRRLLATGSPDNSFVAPDFIGSNITKLLLQPNGRVFVGGNIIRSNGLQLN